MMDGIIELHHDIMFYLIVIIGVIVWLLVKIINNFAISNESVQRNNVTQNHNLELL
jgi:flagellar biogenesis protein FliO